MIKELSMTAHDARRWKAMDRSEAKAHDTKQEIMQGYITRLASDRGIYEGAKIIVIHDGKEKRAKVCIVSHASVRHGPIIELHCKIENSRGYLAKQKVIDIDQVVRADNMHYGPKNTTVSQTRYAYEIAHLKNVALVTGGTEGESLGFSEDFSIRREFYSSAKKVIAVMEKGMFFAYMGYDMETGDVTFGREHDLSDINSDSFDYNGGVFCFRDGDDEMGDPICVINKYEIQ